jgi:hypothetical protein
MGLIYVDTCQDTRFKFEFVCLSLCQKYNLEVWFVLKSTSTISTNSRDGKTLVFAIEQIKRLVFAIYRVSFPQLEAV